MVTLSLVDADRKKRRAVQAPFYRLPHTDPLTAGHNTFEISVVVATTHFDFAIWQFYDQITPDQNGNETSRNTTKTMLRQNFSRAGVYTTGFVYRKPGCKYTNQK